ncbi:MAG TPA: hypothetical protein VMF08_21875 [Candidatus Sulfotelmatobacter sp.]|nr:hypothetical protein [Candidatus Sulfotelmatobacter sp.]
MRTTNRTGIISLTAGIALIWCSAANLHAQDTNVDWGAASDDQVILQAIEQTTPVPSNDVPFFATFYSAQHSPISAQPWPPLPADIFGLSSWNLGSNVWLVDDVGFDYNALSAQTSQSMMAMDADPPLPGGDDGGTNILSPGGVDIAPFDPGTNLWIAQEAISGGNFTGILSNTIPGVSYQLLYANSLSHPVQWIPDGLVVGTDGTNWTPWDIPFSSATNFFLNALSWQTDGSGIPIWWQLRYFGTNNLDPYADPTGDGYTLYQDFINGWVPTNWMQPPAPQGLAVDSFNSASDTATLSWLPSPGPVTGYTMQTPDGTVNVGLVTSYIDNESSVGATYSVEADYAGGPSAWSGQVSVSGDPAPNAAIVPGPQGSLYLVASGLPPDLSAMQITLNSWDSGGSLTKEFPQSANYVDRGNFPTDPLNSSSFQIPAAEITNGICEIPPSDVSEFFPYQFAIETIRSNGVTSVPTLSGSPYGSTPLAEVPFIDGRVDFKDNLRFLFRAANDLSSQESFQFTAAGNYGFGASWPLDHICVGLYSDGTGYYGPYIASSPDPLEPLEDNAFYKNFVFDPNNLISIQYWEMPNTGVSYQYVPTGPYDGYYGLDYNFDQVEYSLNVSTFLADPSVPASAIGTNDSTYITPSYNEALFDFDDYFAENGETNVYGLPFVAAEGVWNTNNDYFYQTFYPGEGTIAGWPFPDAQQPDFQIVDYYFCRPGVDPMPEDGSFAPTNTTPLIIVPVGGQQPLGYGDASTQLAGYARVSVGGAFPGVYGYIGQYFTNAYQIDGNGNVTTNIAGLLSPYGQFLATEPGPAALVTMPDPDTGQQGTCTVYCVSMNVDKNHDGVMETSFNSADSTSQASPMEFWVNDGCDVPGQNGSYDRDLQVPPQTSNYKQGIVTCQRDLENFARLWISGMPPLPAYGSYQVTLSWGSVVCSNPAINLYVSVETNGGTGYLTDTNIAESQCAISPDNTPGMAIVTNIAPGQPYTFPPNYFEDGGNQYFLFEGAGIGEGELMLTVYENGNAIAQTGVWLDLHDAQDFFEHPRASDVSLADPPTTNTGAFTIDSYETARDASEDTNIVIYVHGVNNTQFVYEDFNASIFKRLYWQGYHGRYAAFRWPCPLWSLYPVNSNQVTVLGYNKTEYVGWQSGMALKNYIDDLRTRFPGYNVDILATSGGGAVANNAIRLGAHVDNFAMLVVTLPAEAFDGNDPSLTYDYLATGPESPDADALGGYNNCFTNALRIVNFYNDDDYACFTGPGGAWEFAQKYTRPDQSFTIPDFVYSFDGTNCFFKELDDNGITIFSRTLTQDYEKKCYVARSRTKAIGAAGLKYPPNALAGGAITANISLQDATLGFVGGAKFGDSRADHSGEYAKPIQDTTPFYKELLNEGFLIAPSP